jgi:hypothetical protein
VVDTKVYATSYKFYSFELSPVICEDPSEYVESVYDTLHELDRCFLRDVYYWHSFHPFDVSIVMNKNMNPPGALGKMLTISIP